MQTTNNGADVEITEVPTSQDVTGLKVVAMDSQSKLVLADLDDLVTTKLSPVVDLINAETTARISGDSAKVDTSNIANNLTTTAAGMVLDARQGKVLNDAISATNSNLAKVPKSMSITTLRAYAGTDLEQVLITDNRKEGIFTYKSFDTSSADNGSTIIVTANNRRYYRSFGNIVVNALTLGFNSDAGVDNTDAFNKWLTMSGGTLNTVKGAQRILYIPPGTYLMNGAVLDPEGVVYYTIIGDDPATTEIKLNNDQNVPLFTVKKQAVISFKNITLNGNKENQDKQVEANSHGILFSDISGGGYQRSGELFNVHLWNFHGDAIHLGQYRFQLEGLKINIYQCNGSGLYMDSRSSDSYFEEVYIAHCDKYGWMNNGDTNTMKTGFITGCDTGVYIGNTARHFVLRGMQVDRHAKQGVYINGVDALGGFSREYVGGVIESCAIQNNSRSADNTYPNIHVRNSISTRISNNTFYVSPTSPILTEGHGFMVNYHIFTESTIPGMPTMVQLVNNSYGIVGQGFKTGIFNDYSAVRVSDGGFLPTAKTVADQDVTTYYEDAYIIFTSLTAPRTVTLTNPFEGKKVKIVDESGAAGTFPIKIIGTGIETTLNAPNGSIEVYFRYGSWHIESRNTNAHHLVMTATGANQTTVSMPHGLKNITNTSFVQGTPNNNPSLGVAFWTIDATYVNAIYGTARTAGAALAYSVTIRA